MSKYELKMNKEDRQINDSMFSANQFKMNQEEFKKMKSSPIKDFNKNLKESKSKFNNKDNQLNQNNNAEEFKVQQTQINSLNPGKLYKVYTDQGNKNSILFKFRSEINKSQQIVDREVEKTINLRLKYSRKRIRTTELRMRGNFFNANNNSSQANLQNGFNAATNNNNYLNKKNNNFGKFNFQNAFKNLEGNSNNNNNETISVSSKFKTATGFFRNENNNGNNNNLFNTQIKINNNINNINNNNKYDNYQVENNLNKKNSKINSPEKNHFDSPNRANSQNLNSNQKNSPFKTSATNQVNPFHSMSNRTAGMLGLNNINNHNNNNPNSIGGNNIDNATSNKQLLGFNATSDYFPQGSKVIQNRIKSYNIYFINNWFDKNQIPFQNFTTHMVNNIEFQSNTIIDQMRVLLDSINHFKLQFLQGKNLVTIFKNLDPKRQVKYNKYLEEACGLLMEISVIILMDFTQYLEKFASIQPPTKERLNKSEVKDEEANFFYNIKLFSDITVYLKGCFEVYLILIKQLDDMLLQYKTFLKLLQFLARSRLGISNLIFTAKNAYKNYCSDQSSVNKYIGVVLDINKGEEAELEEKMNEVSLAAASRSKKTNNNYPRIPKTANFKKRMNNEDLSEKIRKQFMFRLNEDNQKIIRLNNVLNRKEYDNENSFEKKKKEISKKRLQGSCLNSNLITKLLKFCPKQVKNQIISQRIIEMYKEKETHKNQN